MPPQDYRLSLAALTVIIVHIRQQLVDLFLTLLHGLQHFHHYLEIFDPFSQEIHLSRTHMVPHQCTDTDVTTPLLDRLMWQEYPDLLRRTHLQMQRPRILMQRLPGCSQRPRQQLVSARESSTQTSPDQFGTVAEAPAQVTNPKAVESGTSPAGELPAPTIANPSTVSSQTETATAPAPTAAAATSAAGIAEIPEQAQSTMKQGDSGYSSNGMQDRDGAASREPLPFRPGDTNNAAPKDSSDRNHASSGDDIPIHNSDDEGRDAEEHG